LGDYRVPATNAKTNSSVRSYISLDDYAVSLTIVAYRRSQLAWNVALGSLVIEPLLFALGGNTIALPGLHLNYYHNLNFLLAVSSGTALIGLFRDWLWQKLLQVRQESQSLAPTFSALVGICIVLTSSTKIIGLSGASIELQGVALALLAVIIVTIARLGFRTQKTARIRHALNSSLKTTSGQRILSQCQELQLLWIAPIVAARLIPFFSSLLILLSQQSAYWLLPSLFLSAVVLHQGKPEIKNFVSSCTSCGRAMPCIALQSNHCIDCRLRRRRSAIEHELLTKSRRNRTRQSTFMEKIHCWFTGEGSNVRNASVPRGTRTK
jgi:hypothetical protein